MHVFFVTTGTRGDLMAFLSLARIAKGLGLDCVLLSNGDHAELAQSWEVPFRTICEADAPQEGRDLDQFFARTSMPGYVAIYEALEAARASSPDVLVVSRSGNWGAQFAAERLNLVFGRVALQPCAIRRGGHPMSSSQMEQLNCWRAKLGLARLPLETAMLEWSDNTLSLFPDWFGAPESDWPEAGQSIGFPFLDGDCGQSPDRLERFLAVHDQVAVFSAGTGVKGVETLYLAAEDFGRRANLAVVFLSRYAPAVEQTNRLLTLAHADHHLLLPRACLLVSHGGIGTVAQAIRAAIPHIILPLDFDQPDNAARVQALGLGASLPPTASAELIAETYDRLRADVQLGERLARAADRVDVAATNRSAAAWLGRLAEKAASVSVGHMARAPRMN
jgi:UDP:flavonoid glycosyltransferase YjiC (YdhE family)